MARITLRHLTFTGSNTAPASLHFSKGLNVLYGASETGKSFVLEAINFMLGGSTPLRDLPERRGFDQIFLGFEISDDGSYTLYRSSQGGDFKLFSGLHERTPDDQEGTKLRQRHNASNEFNVSYFLLKNIGLNGKSIKKNASTSRSLSFRDIARFILISEEEIHKQGSPVESGDLLLRTPEFSAFKLLLSGVDDSSVVNAVDPVAAQISSSNASLVDELLVELKDSLGQNNQSETELREQLEKLDTSIKERQDILRSTDANYRKSFAARIDAERKLTQAQSRSDEVTGLVERFSLLRSHYSSDLMRLEALSEAGSLMNVLPLTNCPLCGAAPDHQHQEQSSDGNLSAVVEAATSEAEKIRALQSDLDKTIEQLKIEFAEFERLIPEYNGILKQSQQTLDEISSSLIGDREIYLELVDKKSEIQSALIVWDRIESLNKRRQLLSIETVVEASPPAQQVSRDLSSTTLDEFSVKVESILKAWDFPDADRVHFDPTTRDLVISGKHRGSRGKGMRSITHAAFSIALLEFSLEHNTGHPGFIVIDSPLLAYREPESEEDDLSGTAVQNRFYSYLSTWSDKQILIIENVTPPAEVLQNPTTTFFGKTTGTDERYGFFPIQG